MLTKPPPASSFLYTCMKEGDLLTSDNVKRTRDELGVKVTQSAFPVCVCSVLLTSCPFLLSGFVLQSYMEDHLKNKDRLEKEWEALCAYQAEPSACTVGVKDGNAKKNRSAAVVACKQRRTRTFTYIGFTAANPILYLETNANKKRRRPERVHLSSDHHQRS